MGSTSTATSSSTTAVNVKAHVDVNPTAGPPEARPRPVERHLLTRRVAGPARSGYLLGMKLKGTIRRSDLEGGHWVLETDSGDRYQLTGSLTGAKDGMAAEVEGKVDKNAMGIGMTGPQLNVQKITAR